MDIAIRNQIRALIEELEKEGHDVKDPVVNLILASLVHQARKIQDEIDALPERVTDRLMGCYIPREKIEACPAICNVELKLRLKKGVEAHTLEEGTFFNYKLDTRTWLNYYPIFRNQVLPVENLHVLAPGFFITKGEKIPMETGRKGTVWVGLEIQGETETLENVSFYLKGTHGLRPVKVTVADTDMSLEFVPASRISEVPMMSPFDSQQMSPATIETMFHWQKLLNDNREGELIYIIDRLRDRDIFKKKAYPKAFQQLLESKYLDGFDEAQNGILWLQMDFGQETDIPDSLEIIPNVVPATNVNVNSVTLTQTSPIAKLTKDDGSYFLNILETTLSARKQGFNPVSEDIVVRDFDASVYNRGSLYRDIRNLYNRFVEDYQAFVDYHALKDGELLRNLRELVNRISKGVENSTEVKNRYDEGTYAMRSVALSGNPASVKVSYLTTAGSTGNGPKAGEKMENKKDAALEKDVVIVESAKGGTDKARPDERYELMRYYTLTADRLYTRMDVKAFLRLQIIKEFGKEEAKRISYEISIEGAGAATKLVRGLYIDITFKDDKNYRKAVAEGLAEKFTQEISDRSCISMPIIISLNKE